MRIDLEKIVLRLKRDRIANLSAIGFVENNPISEVVEAGRSLLIKGTSDVEWVYLICDGIKQFRMLLEKAGGSNDNFASVEDHLVPVITENRKPELILTAMRLYLPDETEVPGNRIAVVPLPAIHAEFVIAQSNYKQFLTRAYLEDRLKRSFSAAVFVEGKLAAWGLTHDDGALGVLHVPEEYRGKGYGKEILISLIHQSRKLGKLPFVQIEEKNFAATSLAERLGFVKDRRVNWIKLGNRGRT